MTTTGDIDVTSPLSKFSSKGVFTKELDIALLNGTIDMAVHCLKDLPTILPNGLVNAAILERRDVEDAVILHPKHQTSIATSSLASSAVSSLDTLPPGSVIGTSALRRIAVLSKHYPHLKFASVRGNVGTRLSKLDAGG